MVGLSELGLYKLTVDGYRRVHQVTVGCRGIQYYWGCQVIKNLMSPDGSRVVVYSQYDYYLVYYKIEG